MDQKDFDSCVTSMLASQSGDYWWVNKMQKNKTPEFYNIKQKIQLIMFGLLDRTKAKDLKCFITEDLIPVEQIRWIQKIHTLKERLKDIVETTQKSLLVFTAKQDSMYPEIKPSIIKFLNPAVLCPNVNTVVLLHEWHRQYAYRHESVEKKQRIDSNVIECCIENKIYDK